MITSSEEEVELLSSVLKNTNRKLSAYRSKLNQYGFGEVGGGVGYGGLVDQIYICIKIMEKESNNV